jgi:hypothetical protein
LGEEPLLRAKQFAVQEHYKTDWSPGEHWGKQRERERERDLNAPALLEHTQVFLPLDPWRLLFLSRRRWYSRTFRARLRWETVAESCDQQQLLQQQFSTVVSSCRMSFVRLRESQNSTRGLDSSSFYSSSSSSLLVAKSPLLIHEGRH